MPEKDPIFNYRVNLFAINKHFRDNGKTPKYYEYQSHPFYGAVIRCHEPLPAIDGVTVGMIIRNRFSNGKFRGVKIDLITNTDPRNDKYDIDWQGKPWVKMKVEKNPGNIVINNQPALTSLFFHDHNKKESVIINLVEDDGK